MEFDRSIDITECELVYPPLDDTFLLLDCLSVVPGEQVLEMGCGTGLVSCHLARAGAELTAADINPRAVECTKANLRRNDLPGQVILSDLFENVNGRFDLITFNPPYLAAEEVGVLEAAWAGGKEGLDVVAPFLDLAPSHLKEGGRIVLLLSSEMSVAGVDRLLALFARTRLGTRRCFFEELWVEELRPL